MWTAFGCNTFDPDEAGRWPTPRRGMVVSEHPLASRAGMEILEASGNAVDAAVATALALAVVYPKAGNLGGGGFAVWVPHDPGEAPRVLDFRETAPQRLAQELFRDADGEIDPTRSRRAPLGVAVPGSPAGLWALHERGGRLPFERVAAPALRLAREGFPVDPWLARDLRKVGTRGKLLSGGMARTVFYPDGQALDEGQLLRQPVLADTIQRLVREGPDGFYRGDVAEAIVAALRPLGGVLELEDLARYRPVWRAPLRGWFRGLEIVTVPPPSSGGLVFLQVLSMLDGFPLDEELERAQAQAAARGHEPTVAMAGLSARAVHWWIETMRRAFADRARHMGDPDFHDVPVDELLAPSWIAERRVSIGEFANPDIGPLDLQVSESYQTTHLSVLDRDGNAVSLTTTLNEAFGSGLMVRGGGFLLNNEIDDFAVFSNTPNAYGLVGGEANRMEPGKRPLSSMTPLVVRDGGQVVRMVLGSPGGPRIITSLLQVFLRTEVYGQGLADAVEAPRLHQQWNPSFTRFEPDWDPLLLQQLESRGHVIEREPDRWSSVQAIRVEVGGEPEGASDPRRGGAVATEGRGVSAAERPGG